MSKYNVFMKNNTKVTPENLKILYDELLLMHNNSYLDKHEEQSKEVIQYVIEYLIYGDKHDSSIFDIFCEFNFMNEFIYLSNLNNRSINLQIIKSFSVLILNLTNTTTLYYIFSNNFINQIITNDYEKYDDDFLSYYVNFIKSLSLKIDTTTIQFFFHKGLNSFPLLQSALKLYNHNDPMIKNVVRNIILTVLKIKYEPIVDYFSTLPSITYFPFLACRLRDLVLKLNEQILLDDQYILKNVHDDIIDDILYLQDIFSLKLDKINYILTNSVFYYLILPLLCGSLVSMTKPKIAISVSIYVLLTLFYYIKDENFLNSMFTICFAEKMNEKMIRYIEEYPKNVKNYFFDWNSQKKSGTYSTSFTNYVSSNFSEPFLKSLLYQTNSNYSEVIALIKKYEKLADEINPCSAGFLKSFMEDVLGKFSNSEFNIMTTYHMNISIATGVNVGFITNDYKQDCFLKVLEKFYEKTKNEESEIINDEKENDNKLMLSTGSTTANNFKKNECRENLYSYLRSKDDTLILLVSLLMFTIHRKNISKEILSKARLLRASDLAKSDYDTNRILTEIFSIDYNSNDNSISNDFVNLTSRNTLNTQNERSSKSEFGLINLENKEEKQNNFLVNANINQLTAEELNNSENSVYEVTNETINSGIDKKKESLTFENISYKPNEDSTVENTGSIKHLKNIEDEISLFYNEFFKKFYFGSCDVIQKIYDSDMVDNLLNLLMVEPAFRTITNRIILENISSLIIKDEGLSFVERSQLDIINKIYYSYLSNIKLIILNNKYIRETGFELFEQEWKVYKGDIFEVVEDLVSRPFLLIPFNLEDVVEDYPKILRIQKTEVDNFKSNLIIFMTLHDLRNKIYKENELIKNNFPLRLGGFDLELDQSYDIANIGIEMYPCKLKFSHSKNYLNYILLIYQNHMYFAQPDIKDSQFALIKYKYALRHLEAQFDRSDPRILNLIVKDKNNYIDLALYFEDVNKTSSVKKSLEEQRKSSRNTEYLLLDSYFDDLISKWRF